MRAERHVAEHNGGPGNVNAFAEPWLFAQERVELFQRIFHAGNLIPHGGKVADKRGADGSSA
jgi:hypothetical protein